MVLILNNKFLFFRSSLKKKDRYHRLRMLLVTVPQNSHGGEELIVACPDGQKVRVVIPLECAPGDSFKMAIPEKQAAPQNKKKKYELVTIKVPPGLLPSERFNVKLADGRSVSATVPMDGPEEFQLSVEKKSSQNWHDSPLAVAPMFLGPLFF